MVANMGNLGYKLFELTAILAPIIGVQGSEDSKFTWTIQTKNGAVKRADKYAGIIVTNFIKTQKVYHPFLSDRKPLEDEIQECKIADNRDKFIVTNRSMEAHLKYKTSFLVEKRIPYTAHQMSKRAEQSKCIYFQLLYMNILGTMPRIIGCITKPGHLPHDPYMFVLTPQHNLLSAWTEVLTVPSNPG